MMSYEQDPDVVRWGLQLFEANPYANCGYCSSVMQDHADHFPRHYIKECYCDTGCSNAGNNEYCVNNLQEELSRLSVNQSSNCFHGEFDNSHPSFQLQNWSSQPSENCALSTLGAENSYEAAESGISSSASSPGGESYCGDEWKYPAEVAYAYSTDDEMGKIFNQMSPMPHIPKIVGEIPSIDEATSDHQRLLDRLRILQLVEFKVRGDGNCQFRALSDQFYHTPEHHKFVRRQVVNQLKSCPEIYEGYVPMPYAEYLRKMSKRGEWGDHVTLQAAADSYGVKILVITSFKDTCYIEISPNVQKSERVIFLSFWAEVHYNSIYHEGDCPAFRTRRRKKYLAAHHEHVELPDDYTIQQYGNGC